MKYATTQRLLLGLAVLMMLVPTILLAAGKLGQAPLWDGDVRKEMTCLTCQGVGRPAPEKACPTCYNRGVAEYIVPGPERPLQLVGTVHNPAGEPLVGAKIEARETEHPEGTPLVLQTNNDGQFGMKLPPGSYSLQFSHENLSLEQTVEAVSNSEPIPAKGSETLHKIEKTFVLNQG